MTAINDRYTIRSFTAVGSAPLGGVQGFGFGPLIGSNLLVESDGNFEANLLADHFGDGTYVDVTTWFFGGATFTQAKKFGFIIGYLPWALSVNVTSIQAGKHVRFASSF